MDTPFELPAPANPDRHHFRAALEMRNRIDQTGQRGIGFASADLYLAYKAWALDRGFTPVTPQAWAKAMKAAELYPYTHLNTRMWMLP